MSKGGEEVIQAGRQQYKRLASERGVDVWTSRSWH